MERKLSKVVKPTSLFLILYGSLSMTVYAQTVVLEESIEDWFYNRLVVASILGFIVGYLVGAFYLSRLKFQVGELDVNRQAQSRLFICWIFLIVIGALLLLVDIWQLHRFGPLSLSLGDAFSHVWLGYRTVLILLATSLTFYLAAAIATKVTPGSRCPYALPLLPWQRAR